MLSIPLFLRGLRRTISIVTHLDSFRIFLVITPGYWCIHIFAWGRSTWKWEVGVIPRSTGNCFKRTSRMRFTVLYDIIILGHCIMIILGHCVIINLGHCLSGLYKMRLVGTRVVDSIYATIRKRCSNKWQSRAPDHWRALECLSQTPAERRQDKTKRPRQAMGYGNERGELSLEGCPPSAVAERG